jgi:ribosome assembly protein YihI (activator of Der GTPase)
MEKKKKKKKKGKMSGERRDVYYAIEENSGEAVGEIGCGGE